MALARKEKGRNAAIRLATGKKTDAADFYLRLDITNRRRWPITVTEIDVLAKNIDCGLFDVWGSGNKEADIFAEHPPVRPDLEIAPQEKGGCSFLLVGTIDADVKVSVRWLDRSEKIKSRTKILRFPKKLLPTESSVKLEEIPRSRS
ncbi:MAG: hypothetical protein EXQ86_01250 [Rhodospirillales bacterium]|nr:hypothetical protein [Rhodospirillales bacterium]